MLLKAINSYSIIYLAFLINLKDNKKDIFGDENVPFKFNYSKLIPMLDEPIAIIPSLIS